MCKNSVVEACAGPHIRLYLATLKCQNTRKSSLICVFLVVNVASKMIGNILVKFDGAGYSFYFISDFEVFEGDPGFSSWGRPFFSSLHRFLAPRNTLESN